MPHILKNKVLEIQIDLPLENYNYSRFDWTGKIVNLKFNNIPLSSTEKTNSNIENKIGKGFYNEFGIDTALGFEEANIGDWFHKIGVGLLKKEDSKYHISKNYKIKPAAFEIITKPNKLIIICKAEAINGYAYILKKEIVLHDSCFTINYFLQNTGEKEIITDEYVHNFIAINNENIGAHYTLNFPFLLKPKLFEETVNPEQKVAIGKNNITFNIAPKVPFFFSNLSGNETINARWELVNNKNNIGIRETGNFKTNKVNVWGSQHVISPELFYKIAIKPGEINEWSRQYKVFKTN